MTPRRLIDPARLASTGLLRRQSDARLVDLTRAGNEQAFEAIVHRYRRPLLRYCGRILPPGRAEDAVQQAFLSAYRAIRDGDNDLLLRPWLYRVARNSALNLLRQNGWNHEQLHEDMDGVMRPDQAVEGRERIRSLFASVKGLPERQRDAIVLRELEGRSYEEIAVALGVTDGAVRQLLNRARTTLRAGATALTPYGLAERLAEIAGGAGGVASLAKVGAAVLVAGAVATGGATQVGNGGSAASKSTVDSRQSAVHRLVLPAARSPFAVRRSPVSREVPTRRNASHHADGGRRHEGSAFAEDLSSRDDRSGSSGGDSHSGSGDSGGGSGSSSGPGSGGDQLMTTSSGEGSGSSGSDMSGSGSSGSGSSDGGSATTTTSSTSGTSGSSDGGSTTTTSGGGTSGGSH